MLRFLFFFTASICASTYNLKEIPEDCFSSELFCNTYEITKVKKNNEIVNAIAVNVFALIPKDNFSTTQEIIDHFLDFNSLLDNFNNTENLYFNDSRKLKSSCDSHRHYTSYTVKAPWPINQIVIKEVTDYKEVTSPKGSNHSLSFKVITDKEFNIDGYTLKGAEGLIMRSGHIHVSYSHNFDAFFFYYQTLSIPEINMLPNIAAPFISKSNTDLISGLYSLY